jgi:maltose phosphorylase
MSSSVLSTKRAAHVGIHPWKLIENQWNAERHIESESLFALGNGRMGQRANHEETFTGDTLPGSYIAGVYYPDKTKVGWWKNGYPEYFAKVLNSVNWIAVNVKINEQELDLNTCAVESFYRELNMETGVLTRRFTARLEDGTGGPRRSSDFAVQVGLQCDQPRRQLAGNLLDAPRYRMPWQ